VDSLGDHDEATSDPSFAGIPRTSWSTSGAAPGRGEAPLPQVPFDPSHLRDWLLSDGADLRWVSSSSVTRASARRPTPTGMFNRTATSRPSNVSTNT